MKTKEELNAIREELAGLANKLKELSEQELETVVGGSLTGTVTPMLAQWQISRGKTALWNCIDAENDTLPDIDLIERPLMPVDSSCLSDISKSGK